MLNVHFGIAQFQTLQVRSCWNFFDINEFEISAPHCPTRYSPAGNGDGLDIVIHQNVRLSEVIVSDVLDSDHLPILFHILDHDTTRNLSKPIELFTVLDRFQSFESDLVSPRIKINSGVEADNAARDFTATIASAYRLSIYKVILSDLNSDLPSLDLLLKHKQKLRKLWHETRDTACKTVVNCVTINIRRMTQKALERWETKIGNCEVTPQAIWPNAKSHMKRDGPKAPTAIHGLLSLKYHQLEKANAIADCLENPMTCVTETMKGGWRLEFRICLSP
jgi:hypothetical protein